MKTEDIIKECKDLVEKVCVKFNYDTQDTEKNDSLKTVLLKIIPAMLKDSPREDRDLFYQMLTHTPIVITENLTQEGYKKLEEYYIGKNVNQNIIEKDVDLGEYGKNIGAGAYVSEPILDQNMKLQGKKSFIYIQKISEKGKEIFGTDINVSHLIHELGHAWHSEKEQFVMQEDGTLKERVGTAEFVYSFSNIADEKFEKECISTTGLMLEESLNTVAEEKAMANYMNISVEEMQKIYSESLVKSQYQGYMANLVDYMLKKIDKHDFENYRLHGDLKSKNKINSLMEKTAYWKNRLEDVLPYSDSPRNYNKKRAIFDKINNTKVQDFFKEYDDVYFPDLSQMTPIEKIDNILMQKYNMSTIMYNMKIDDYKRIIEMLSYEGYPLINQAAELVDLNRGENNSKKINLSTVVKNALIQGTTQEQINKANQIEENLEYIKEGEERHD